MVSRINRFTIYHAILHFIFTVTLLAAFVTLLFGYFFFQQRYVQSIFERYTITLNATKDNITSYIQSHMRTAQHIVENQEIIDFLSNPSAGKTLSADFQKKLNDFSHSTIIFSPERKPLFSSDGHLDLYENNPILRDSLERSQILNDTDLSDFFFAPGEKPRIYITLPIVHKKRFIGSFAIALHMDILQQLASDYTGLGATGEIIVAQRIGNEIKTIFPTRFNPHAAFATNDPHSEQYAVIEDALNGTNGTKIIRNSAGEQMMVAWHYTPLTYNEWAIVVQGSYEEALQPFFSFKIFLICLALLFVCGIAYFAYKSWSHAEKTIDLPAIFAKVFLVGMYLLFIANSAMLILFFKNQYTNYHLQQQKDRLIFKGDLQKAVQTIDYHIAILENEIGSLALDITRGILTRTQTAKTLEKELHDNNDIDGIVCAFKNDDSWTLITALREQGQEKVAQQENVAEQPWMAQAQEQQATWIYRETPWKKEPMLMYNLPFYDQNDFEQKRPVGFIAIICAQQRLLHYAHQQISTIPLLLLEGNGTIVYQDAAISLNAHKIDPLHNTHARLYLEKATHLGWFIGSMAPHVPLNIRAITIFVLGTIVMLISIALFSICLLRYYLRNKRYRHELLVCFVITVICTALGAWLTFWN